ncbi:hypothetical protein MLD38_027972 [Melastoma candidum]|uniref:Uncharacterized protein n=1 Tax=Melastoma candidum TaxID=119954 RepID=A0ACB9MZR6_9MYRT|nr:hypothetical protein MLD38_027972 [Melastoma candidum]
MSTGETVRSNENSRNQEFSFFIIEFYVSRVYFPGGDCVGSRSATTYKQFRQKCNHLVLETTSWSTISRMLSQVDVPFHMQPAMIAKISDAARAISAGNRDLEFISLVVLITLIEPGNNKGIESLETVQDGCGGSAEESCVICMDNVGVSPRRVRTPCQHVYHGECIAGWLERSNSCPLCRFHLPTIIIK